MADTSIDMGTPFDSLDTYTPGTGGGLAGEAARANIAAAPDLSRLSELITQINHMANQNRVTGGAALEQASSQNIADELAGNLPASFIGNLQSNMAQRGGAGGFGVDSANTNAAALRSMGMESMARQAQGQSDLNAAYSRAAPAFDVNQAMLTPALLQQQQDQAAQRALQAQQIGDQAAEWRAQLAERDTEFRGTIAQQQADLAARMGLSYAQLGEQARQFDVGEAGQTTRLGLQLAATARENELNNTIRWAQMQQEQNQYASTLTQRQTEYAGTQAENARQYNASLANQQSQFGQTLAYNTAGQTEAQRQYNASLANQQGQYASTLANQQSQFGQTLAQQQAQLAQSGETAYEQLYGQLYHTLPTYSQTGSYLGAAYQSPVTTAPAQTYTPPVWSNLNGIPGYH